MKFKNSKSGFTLIELLVVIGILAVLAAIAIPSVAGLIDRANVSADATNANEMTNAVERFASEYELYRQDLASGTLNLSNLDSVQGLVLNVIKASTRGQIDQLESESGFSGRKIDRDTKYPLNPETMKAVVENYTKTSSSTFEPKQSDKHFWYSPDCGIVVVADPNSSVAQRNELIVSGMDATGKPLTDDTNWIDLTSEIVNGESGASDPDAPKVKFGVHYILTDEESPTEVVSMIFNSDGSLDYQSNNDLMKGAEGAGAFIYDGCNIIESTSGETWFTVSEDGKYLYNATTGELGAIAGTPIPLVFGQKYIHNKADGGYCYYIFHGNRTLESQEYKADGTPNGGMHGGMLRYNHDDRTVIMYYDGENGELESLILATVSADGTYFIDIDGTKFILEQ